jgi:hypothetical protein
MPYASLKRRDEEAQSQCDIVDCERAPLHGECPKVEAPGAYDVICPNGTCTASKR